ncbi:MAG: hypothetical protein ABSH06_29810 [Thermodesulfobacteriota bacterium]|jgi:hypothetical protein
MRKIQQLIYGGKRLFCPDHPDRKLEEAGTVSEHGGFSMLCTAPVGPGHNCMNSAQWPSREDMLRDLGEGND